MWRAWSAVDRALCRFRVSLCRVRAAFDPAPAPVLGMAAADAAPGGGLLCAEAGSGPSARMRTAPIEAKIVLRIAISPGRLLGSQKPYGSALRQRLQKVRRKRIFLGLRRGEVEGRHRPSSRAIGPSNSKSQRPSSVSVGRRPTASTSISWLRDEVDERTRRGPELSNYPKS